MERVLCRGFHWLPGTEQSRAPFQESVPRQVPTSPVGSAPSEVELRLLSGPSMTL